jgi:hypothetical protein
MGSPLVQLNVPSTMLLQSVDEKRTPVAQVQELLLRVPRPNCLLAFLVQHLPPRFVFAIARLAQDVRHDNRRDANTQSNAEAYGVFGRLRCNVNVRTRDAA